MNLSIDTNDTNTTHTVVREHRELSSDEGVVALRRIPYPYKAALAICSDIDDTKTSDDFLELHRFLNTRRATSMGEGVGLEIANSIYFYDNEDYFSYFTHAKQAQPIIEHMIRAGYIDCLHSYGDQNTSRDEILRAIDVLDRIDCKLDIWVNHNGGLSNLSRKFEYLFDRNPCLGAVPNSPVYHADVSIAYGIRFAWVGAYTRIIGQTTANSSPLVPLLSVVDHQHPLNSAASLLKELRKRALGSQGDERFVLHQQNQLTRPLELEDGQYVHEFIRYCDHPRGLHYGGTAHGLAHQISKRVLEHLKTVGGFTIIYTHLGQNRHNHYLLPPETQAALRRLAEEYRSGNIYVTTTSRLLNYYQAYTSLVWSYRQEGEQTVIDVDHINDPIFGRKQPTPRQLQGMTFYVPNSQRADVYIRGIKVTGLERNPPDEQGGESVSIPRVQLTFPF